METATNNHQNDRKPTPLSSEKPIPTWLPVSLVSGVLANLTKFTQQIILISTILQLAVTTTALAVPILLLRHQRAKALLDALPPRRMGVSANLASRFISTPIASSSKVNYGQWPPPRRNSGTAVLPSSRYSPRASSASLTTAELDELKYRASSDGFNAPLYTASAFGLSTLIVAVCAFVGVWSIKSSLGVKDVCLPVSCFPPYDFD